MPRFVPLRVVVAALCAWHMWAVLLFALPGGKSQTIDDAKGAFDPLMRPYILSLSQWQQWNLFSPDPLRRITTYRIDRIDAPPGTLAHIGPSTFPRHTHSTWFKYFTSLIDDDSDRLRAVQERYLAWTCARLGVEPGTRVALTLERRVLPKHRTVQSVSWWRSADFPVTYATVADIACPA